MPYYNFSCQSCDAVFELSRKIADRDEVATETCPECSTVGQITRLVGSPMVGYSVTTPGGYGTIPDGFKEVLRRIHKRAPGSRLDKTSSYM